VSARERELAALAAGAYARRLALRASAVGEGTATVDLPFDATLLNRGGRIHGGAIASVALAAGRLAAAASERAGSERWVRSIGANISFLRVPRDAAVTAVASVLERGRDLAHVAVDVVDGDAARVVSAELTCVFLADGDARSTSRATASTAPTGVGTPETISESPYLSSAGMRRFEPAGRVARLSLPFAPNAAANPPRIDDGAIAGLVDSCAAYASYLDGGESLDRSGVTVSMSLNLHDASSSDAVGAGWVLSRSGTSRVAQVEVSDVASGLLVASGVAVYRIAQK